MKGEGDDDERGDECHIDNMSRQFSRKFNKQKGAARRTHFISRPLRYHLQYCLGIIILLLFVLLLPT